MDSFMNAHVAVSAPYLIVVDSICVRFVTGKMMDRETMIKTLFVADDRTVALA